MERRRLQERAEALVRARLGEVFQLANASVDHIPPSVYSVEVGAVRCSLWDDDDDDDVGWWGW